MKILKPILIVTLMCLSLLPVAQSETQSLPESGPNIRIESDENLAELSHACDLENIKTDEMATSGIATQKKVLKSLSASCEKFMRAERRLGHSIRQAKCESLEAYMPTERAIQNCQARLRQNDSDTDENEADIEHRDACIVKLQSQYCSIKSNISSL